MSATSFEMLGLHDALGLKAAGELVSIVGGGGKSTLLFALPARAPAGARWVLSTTTRIFAAQIRLAEAHCTTDPAALATHLDAGVSGLLVIGEVEGDKAIGVPADLPARLLAHGRVDCVALEADGSRRLPTKAPASHEPVIANGTSLVVVVAGIDALDGPIARSAHRPERVAAITGRPTDARLRPEDLAALLADGAGGLKGVPAEARVAVLLNKVETEDQRDAAREAAVLLSREPRIERILIGALRTDCGDFETHARS